MLREHKQESNAGSDKLYARFEKELSNKYQKINRPDQRTHASLLGNDITFPRRACLGDCGLRSLLHVEGETRLFGGLENGDLMTVDLKSGKETLHARLGKGKVQCLLHVKGRTQLYAGFDTGELVTVDIKTGDINRRSLGDKKRVHSLLYIPYVKRLFAGLANGDLKTIDLDSGAEGTCATT